VPARWAAHAGGACTCASRWSHVALLGFLLRVGGGVGASDVLPGALPGCAVLLPEWTTGIALLGVLARA